jgi:hypothetical protein
VVFTNFINNLLGNLVSLREYFSQFWDSFFVTFPVIFYRNAQNSRFKTTYFRCVPIWTFEK